MFNKISSNPRCGDRYPAARPESSSKSRHIGWRAGAGAALVAAVLSVGLGATSASAAPEDAKVKAGHGKVIADQYIVVLKDGANPGAVAARNSVSAKYTYSAAITGFSTKLNKSELKKLAKDADVQFIEPDSVVKASSKPKPPGNPSVDAKSPSQLPATTSDVRTSSSQTGATWGLDRIDQRTSTNGVYNYTDTGAGVTAFVIDTGIYTGHSQFGGRASVGADFIGDGRNGQDCNGHGTHVAGTVGGTTYGVAKGVTLKAVRVLDCSGNGSWASVIAGIDWVTYNHNGPSVANMSLGGGFNSAVTTRHPVHRPRCHLLRRRR